MKRMIGVAALLLIGVLAGYAVADINCKGRDCPVSATDADGKPLTPELEKALVGEKQVGQVAVAAVVLWDGSVKLLPGSRAQYSEKDLPIQAKLRAVRPVSIIAYEGSTCLLWSDGSTGGDPTKPKGGSRVKIYCLAVIP